MNVFEGSRRLAYLVAALATAGTVIFAATYDPFVVIDYSISNPKAPFRRMTDDCPTEAGRHYFTTKSSFGREVSINICLLAMPWGEAKAMLVPYKIDEENMAWGAPSYSDEVSLYKKELEARFSLSEEDNKWLDEEVSRRYWRNWKESLGNLSLGLAVFAAFVWGVGWIIRGFMGIPSGMDKKPGLSRNKAE